MRESSARFHRALRLAACAAFAGGLALAPPGFTRAQAPANAPVVFAALGDTGTGDAAQYDTARAMVRARREVPFDMVLLLGDNTYNAATAADLPRAYLTDFQRPYRELLDAGVGFYGVLGNHDPEEEKFYPPFHMQGRRYYSFARGPALFVGLDSNRMDPAQLAWLDNELRRPLRWKIVFFHHPIYSSGRKHGSDIPLRSLLEPILVKHGVQAVLAGHEHVYLRTKPQSGVTYFVCGSGARLRKGDLAPSPLTAMGFDRDNAFFVGAIQDDRLRFRVVSRTGAIVDTGTILAPLAPAPQVPDLPLPDNPTPPEERDPQTPCVPGNEGDERMLDGRCS
jgi:hypothetical protein